MAGVEAEAKVVIAVSGSSSRFRFTGTDAEEGKVEAGAAAASAAVGAADGNADMAESMGRCGWSETETDGCGTGTGVIPFGYMVVGCAMARWCERKAPGKRGSFFLSAVANFFFRDGRFVVSRRRQRRRNGAQEWIVGVCLFFSLFFFMSWCPGNKPKAQLSSAGSILEWYSGLQQ